MIDLKKLIAVSVPPEEPKDWLMEAEAGVDYLVEQTRNSETILYAALQCTLIQALLAPRENVSPVDQADFSSAQFMLDATWSITHVTGGGKPDRVYLSSPLDHPGCKSLEGGESLIFRRFFHGVDKGAARIEVSQKLIHALDLYWLDEESAFCRLDEHGDVEPVIRVIQLERFTGRDFDVLVTIKTHDLARYMIVTGTALVQKFDFTRFLPGAFGGWGHNAEFREHGSDLFYNAAKQGNASYVNGIMVNRTKLTYDDLVHEYQVKWDDSAKQYATFKAYDWKNQRIAEISCAPNALASYFEKDSPLPFQITPAFFKPDVLQRYKADPEKYRLEARSIHSRAGWSLKTFDVNEEGQVHTYLHYLGDLPYQEQLYWQSFNEWPKASISARAFKTDIMGEWTDIPDPLVELIAEVRRLDDAPLDWWQVRGEELRQTVHYPITTSPDEWGDSLLALDQLLVEGFASKAIRSRLDALNSTYEKDWGTLRLLQELLVAQGFAPADAADTMEPLRTLHFLRSKVKGHASVAQRQQLIKDARTEHGSLKDHFRQLAFDCQEAFEKTCTALA